MNRVKETWELPIDQYSLHQDVNRLLGWIAAASLACVLLDGVKRFMAISEGEVDFIRQLAANRKVALPI